MIVKKSLEEGFGLGVTEAMWKRRPVVASRVGGHQDQIQDGISGVLLDDPRDLATFGGAVATCCSTRIGRGGSATPPSSGSQSSSFPTATSRSGPSYWRRSRRDELAVQTTGAVPP